ncbi:Uncharacterised protein [Enterobacter cancerogenus]|uniref:Uncharacterized protein n=1 Tax=Enterobacter cancerogenus TaxID=69218 RepID=A0A484Z8E6_9ENTR|nr:Uncharacterised protein [Enterobacter cancerogenus]
MPFALVGVHHPGHLLLQFVRNTQAVIKNDLAQIVEAALKIVHPGAGALQAIRRADIEHQEAVDGADQRLFIQVAGEEIRVARFHPAVAAKVEIPAFVRGDHPDIFALRLGALAGTAGNRHFYLMRCPQAFVAVLQFYRETRGVLHAVATPGGPHAGFHRAQRLTVGVPGLKSGLHQRLPDRRQLVERRAKQVDTLPAGDLTVQAVALRDLADGNQPVGRDLPGRHTRHDGVGTVFLDVGKVAVVGVLQRQMCRFKQILVPARGQHRADQRFANFTPVPVTIATNQLFEGAYMIHANEVVDLLTRVREVFADVLFHLHALPGKLELHHLFNQGTTAAAARSRFGALFNGSHIHRPVAYGPADIAFADVMAGTDLRVFRQRRDAQRFWRTAGQRRQNQRFRLFRQANPVEHHLHQGGIFTGIAHQHATEQVFPVVADHNFFIDLLRAVGPLIA